MMARTFGLVAPLVCFVCVTTASAQDRIPTWLTVRGGYAVPTGAVHQSLDAGPAAGVRLDIPLTPVVSGYFGVDGSRSDIKDADVDPAGLLSASIGASFTLPGDAVRPRPFVDVGASLNRWSDRAGAPDGVTHSDWSPGVDLALGVRIPATPRIRLAPALRYRAFRPEYAGTRAGSVSSLSFEVGAGFRN